MTIRYTALTLVIPFCASAADTGAMPQRVHSSEIERVAQSGSVSDLPNFVVVDSVQSNSIAESIRTQVREEIRELLRGLSSFDEKVSALDSYIEENQNEVREWVKKTDKSQG